MRALRAVSTALVLAALGVAAVGRPSLAESPSTGVPEASPSPAPAITDLPEIGRTRATRAACAVLRDLVDPSLAAAHRGDAKFEEARPLLARYVKVLAEKGSFERGMVLSRIEQSYLTALDQALAISKALGDPRLSADVTDPELVTLRRALQVLYDGEVSQTNVLGVWTMKARLGYAQTPNHGGHSEGTVIGKNQFDPFAGGDADAMYAPQLPSDLKGMLALTGDGMTDARRINQFTGELAAGTAAREVVAIRAIVTVTAGCRTPSK